MLDQIYRAAFAVLIVVFSVVMLDAQSTAKESPISSNWSAFVSEVANFSALFPGTPKTRVVDVMTTPIRRQNHWFEVIGPIYFAVCYSDHPMLPSFDDSSLENNYDLLRDNVVKSTKAELVKDEKVQVDSHSGREVTVRLGSSTAISRFLVVNKRLYQAIVHSRLIVKMRKIRKRPSQNSSTHSRLVQKGVPEFRFKDFSDDIDRFPLPYRRRGV